MEAVGLGRGLFSLKFRKKLFLGAAVFSALLILLGGENPSSHQSVSYQSEKSANCGQSVATQEACDTIDVVPTEKVCYAENRDIRVNDKLLSGENITKLLVRNGVDIKEAYRVSSVLRQSVDLKRIPTGCQVFLDQTLTQGKVKLNKIVVNNGFFGSVEVFRTGPNGGFSLRKKPCKLIRSDVAVKGVVVSNLNSDALRKGVPSKIVAQTVNILKNQIDFKRDIKHGDKFELVYDAIVVNGTNLKKAGDLKYVNLTLKNRKVKIYCMHSKGVECNCFDEEGNSLQRNTMQFPVDGGRISSKFGRRAHPILGYSCKHKGVDISARFGAAIRAASNGHVKFVGRRARYGKIVCLSHAGEYSTLYAHMSKFASNIRPGAYVARGQVIGFVGRSGLTTGSHVHFEVMKNGTHLNPLLVGVLPKNRLSGQDLIRFKQLKASVENGLRTIDL
ncbi:MAG: M23 family metallopeptidase [Holosporales bacterium]|nr:M23 family metallopeptidase [Holosporales bacterium]